MAFYAVSLLSLALALCAQSAELAAADPATVKMVEFFVKSQIEDLPPDRVDQYMAVDVQTLPAKLRPAYHARRLELFTLKQLAEGKRKGTVRTPEANCAVPAEAKGDNAGILRRAGFSELEEDEEQYLLQKTQCSERELMCEFSLQIVLERDKKTNKVKRQRYFIYTTDPLMAMVASYRGGKGVGGNTNFFGRASVLCSH